MKTSMVGKFEATRTKGIEMRIEKVDEHDCALTEPVKGKLGVPHSLTHRTHLNHDASQPNSRVSLVACYAHIQCTCLVKLV